MFDNSILQQLTGSVESKHDCRGTVSIKQRKLPYKDLRTLYKDSANSVLFMADIFANTTCLGSFNYSA